MIEKSIKITVTDDAHDIEVKNLTSMEVIGILRYHEKLAFMSIYQASEHKTKNPTIKSKTRESRLETKNRNKRK